METKIPRRLRIDLNTPTELAIHLAMREVEKIGADKKLTEAIILLDKAKNLVADFIDAQKTQDTIKLLMKHLKAVEPEMDYTEEDLLIAIKEKTDEGKLLKAMFNAVSETLTLKNC